MADISEFEAATEEWDNVQEIVPTFSNFPGGVNEVSANEEFKESLLVTIEEFIQDFRQNIDLNVEEEEPFGNENTTVFDSRGANFVGTGKILISWMKCMCLQPRINAHLEEEKKLVFATSKRPFDNENPIHFQVLITLYKQFTGSKLDCPRYGSHWEQIGFQGNDPATDLRGVGCLGLINALYFVMTPELSLLAKAVYKLSLSETQNFPLLVLSINVTRIALHALRDGILNRQIVQENSVWSALNFFYVAIMYHIYHIWKVEHKSIKDSGYVLKDAEKFCRKNVNQAISNLNYHLVTAYSVHEKQAAREFIRKRTNQNL